MSDLKIIYKDIEELVPYANNPRNNDESVDAVANSIEEFGFKVPIILDSKNEIITGHTRLKAAKKLGLEKVPCIIADDLTDEQIKAFRIADNSVGESSKWDFTKLSKELEEIKDFNMEDFNLVLEDLDIDDTPKIKRTGKTKTLTKSEGVTHNSKITLYHGDCLKEMKKIPDKSVDCIITDLPYGTTDCEWDELIPFKDLWSEWERILKDKAAVVLFGDNGHFSARMICSKLNWFSYNWIWKKDHGVGFLNAKAQPLRNTESISVFYKPYIDNDIKGINNTNKLKYLQDELKTLGIIKTEVKKRYGDVHWFVNSQYTLIPEDKYKDLQKWSGGFKKTYEELLGMDPDNSDNAPERVYNPQMGEGKPYTRTRRNSSCEIYGGRLSDTINEGTRYPTQVLEFNTGNNNSSNDGIFHPTQKPIDLLEYLINTYTNEGDLILDCTMGSGSTGVAAKKLGRDFIGIELTDEYFKIATDRINSVETKEKK